MNEYYIEVKLEYGCSLEAESKEKAIKAIKEQFLFHSNIELHDDEIIKIEEETNMQSGFYPNNTRFRPTICLDSWAIRDTLTGNLIKTGIKIYKDALNQCNAKNFS